MVFIRILKTKVQCSVFKEGTSTNVRTFITVIKAKYRLCSESMIQEIGPGALIPSVLWIRQ